MYNDTAAALQKMFDTDLREGFQERLREKFNSVEEYKNVTAFNFNPEPPVGVLSAAISAWNELTESQKGPLVTD